METIEGLTLERQNELFKKVKDIIKLEFHKLIEKAKEEDSENAKFSFKPLVDAVYKAKLGTNDIEKFSVGVMTAFVLKEFEYNFLPKHGEKVD